MKSGYSILQNTSSSLNQPSGKPIFTIPGLSLKSQGRGSSYISTSDAVNNFSDRLDNLPFLVFPEVRDQPIQWYDSLKIGWLREDYSNAVFTDVAQPGEYYTYQIGVWAFNEPVHDINVLFSDLKRKDGISIPAGKITCFNEGGIDVQGNPFSKNVNISSGRVQAFWIGIDLSGVKEGSYEGKVYAVSEGNMQSIPIQLEVDGDEVTNQGFNEGKRLSRMAWLNTTIGLDKEITKGFDEITQEENRIKILGRTITIAPTGLPSQITSFFEPSNQFLVPDGEAVINHPFRFIIEKENGTILW